MALCTYPHALMHSYKPPTPVFALPTPSRQRLDWIFRTGGVNHVFVVDRGRIVGVITKKRLARIASIRG